MTRAKVSATSAKEEDGESARPLRASRLGARLWIVQARETSTIFGAIDTEVRGRIGSPVRSNSLAFSGVLLE